MTELRRKVLQVLNSYTLSSGNPSEDDCIDAILKAFEESLPPYKDQPIWNNLDCRDGWNFCLKTILSNLRDE